MFAVYVFCSVVGGGLLLFSLVFGGDGEADLEVGADVELDVDGGFELEAGDGGHDFFSGFAEFFSVRGLIFFVAFFGMTGLVLDLLTVAPALTISLALGVGVFCAFVNFQAFRYLRRTESSSALASVDAEGCEAQVVLPISSEQRGKVNVRVQGQMMPLLAKPFDIETESSFEVGRRVLVIRVEAGVAYVSGMEA